MVSARPVSPVPDEGALGRSLFILVPLALGPIPDKRALGCSLFIIVRFALGPIPDKRALWVASLYWGVNIIPSHSMGNILPQGWIYPLPGQGLPAPMLPGLSQQ